MACTTTEGMNYENKERIKYESGRKTPRVLEEKEFPLKKRNETMQPYFSLLLSFGLFFLLLLSRYVFCMCSLQWKPKHNYDS